MSEKYEVYFNIFLSEQVSSRFIVKTAKLYGVLFPPILAMVKYDALTTLALALLEEGYLITYAKLYIFANVKMSLTGSLQVEVIPYTGLHTEADVVECLVSTCTIILVEQGTLAVAVDGVIIIIVMA